MAYAEFTTRRYVGLADKAVAREIAFLRLSPVHLLEHALTLAKVAEPAINAYVRFLDDDAGRAVEACEHEARAGRWRGPLLG